jgi:hypothetical protein
VKTQTDEFLFLAWSGSVRALIVHFYVVVLHPTERQFIVVRRLLAHCTVTDLGRAEDWYARLPGRGPDAGPMPGLIEWHLGDSYASAATAGSSNAASPGCTASTRFRTRYERRADLHLGLLQLAWALICYRHLPSFWNDFLVRPGRRAARHVVADADGDGLEFWACSNGSGVPGESL